MSQSPHFAVVAAANPGPVFVEVPHAGLTIDEVSGRFIKLPELATKLRALWADADRGADVVWEGTEQSGVTRVVAKTHRYVIDLNTNPRPPPGPPFYEENALPRLVLRRSAAGISWREDPLPREEHDRRITEIFEPYHAAIEAELWSRKKRHGKALMIASHTFPDRPVVEADVVLGTQEGLTASPSVLSAMADVFRAAGLVVALEQPFPGGFSLGLHARPQENMGAVQIEIARRLLVEPGREQNLLEAGVARFKPILADVARAAAGAL